MKIATETVEIERSSNYVESTFRIKSTSKAFDILSSRLYTKPIEAIVRELSCNAYDAHISAGKSDVPYTIHLPSQLEPWFSVKDEGTGLSDEQVLTLYTTYFDSSKTDSNDFIGALGLGSKSPYSYVPAYEVYSTYQGVRRVYSMFLNEQRIPSVARISEGPATGPDGLEVKVAVAKKTDFPAFAEAVRQMLQYFPVKPNIVGTTNFKFPEYKVLTKGDGWSIIKDTSSYYSTPKLTIIQGHVPYQMQLEKVRSLVSSDHEQAFAHIVRTFESGEILLDFPIGEIDIAANREEIRYETRSCELILKRLCDVISSIMHDVVETFNKDSKVSLWNAYKGATNTINKLRLNRYNLSQAIAALTKLKIPVFDNPTFRAMLSDDASRFKLKIEPNGVYDVLQYSWNQYRGHFVREYRASQDKHLISGIAHTLNIIPSETYVVVVESPIKRLDARLRLMCHKVHTEVGSPSKFDLLVFVRNPDAASQVAKDEFTKIIASLGNITPAEYYTEKDIPSIQAKKRIKGTRASSYIYELAQESSRRSTTAKWVPVLDDDVDGVVEDGGIYVVASRFPTPTFQFNGKGYNLRDDGHMLNVAMDLYNKYHGGSTPLYGVSKKSIKHLDSKKWINLYDAVINILTNTPQDVIEYSTRYKKTTFEWVVGGNCMYLPADEVKLMSDNSPYKIAYNIASKHINHIHSMENTIAAIIINQYKTLYEEIHNITIDASTPLFDKMTDLYPLLGILSSYSLGRDGREEVAKYIRLVDASNGVK